MIIKQHTSKFPYFIKFKCNIIQNISKFKILGRLLKCNGNLRHSIEELSKKAITVLLSLRAKAVSIGTTDLGVKNICLMN